MDSRPSGSERLPGAENKLLLLLFLSTLDAAAAADDDDDDGLLLLFELLLRLKAEVKSCRTEGRLDLVTAAAGCGDDVAADGTGAGAGAEAGPREEVCLMNVGVFGAGFGDLGT